MKSAYQTLAKLWRWIATTVDFIDFHVFAVFPDYGVGSC